MIYKFALTGPNGIAIAEKRRRINRISGRLFTVPRLTCNPATFLRVSTTIFVEAAPILYSQKISFSSIHLLQTFLLKLRPETLRLLKHLIITNWLIPAQWKRCSYNWISTFALLRDAINLRWFSAKDLQSGSGFPLNRAVSAHILTSSSIDHLYAVSGKIVAHALYAQCQSWLDHLMRQGGTAKLAKVLKLDVSIFKRLCLGNRDIYYRDVDPWSAATLRDGPDGVKAGTRAAVVQELGRLFRGECEALVDH